MKSFSILVVDDTYEKVRLVGEVTNRLLGCEIESSTNTREALEKLKDKYYDLLIVDMNLPEFIGESPSLVTGTELISSLFQMDRFKKPLAIVAVTSHADAYEASEKKLIKLGVPLILIKNDDSELKTVISSKVNYYKSLKESIEERFNKKSNDEVNNGSEKITLKWLYDNVPYKFWLTVFLVLLATFSFGIKMSNVEWISLLYNVSHVESDTNDKA